MSNTEGIDPDVARLRREFSSALQDSGTRERAQSAEYSKFKEQYMPQQYSFYEKTCAFAEKLGVAPDATEAERYQHAINTCHLNVTPKGAYSLALIATGFFVFVGLIFALLIPVVLGGEPSIFFLLVFSTIGLSVYLPIKNLPFTFADSWRMRSSNQMVLALFYITTYMRQNSNLERAIDFAAEHVTGPLALDLKKVMWDVQSEKHESVVESLNNYLKQWRETHLEFVEAMNLVQASLYETSQERRLNTLDKAMDIILEETYEKMLHYAQNLKSPMTMLHMLGVILPILGLVILPLAVSFIAEVSWYHIAVLYNIILPVGVFYLGFSILSKRPTGYGGADITSFSPELAKRRGRVVKTANGERIVPAKQDAMLIGGFLLFLGLLPILIHFVLPAFDIPRADPTGQSCSTYQFLCYRLKDGALVGPYGLGASILSLFITLGVGLGFAKYYSLRTQYLIKIRNDTKELEQEFAGALFQLGNRLGDGIPVELAFSKVADIMEGTKSGNFFRACAVNVQKMGMSPEQAIFDKQRGAIMLYPSTLIESSMKVLLESSKRGPSEASQAILNMSGYIKEIHRVDERLKDLMADIISGMKSQISFLTPAIAGIVIGITSMITTILGQLQEQFSTLAESDGGGAGLVEILGLGLPTYHFQAIVGLYVIQITWILAYLVNGIENGEDDLNQEYEQGKGLNMAIILYCGLAFVVMLVFNLIAATILAGASL